MQYPRQHHAPVSGTTLFLAVMGPVLIGMMDQTIVGVALPAMARSLDNIEGVSWIVVVYLGAAAISAPVYGRLGDALGRRRFMMVALANSLLGSLICGLSTSFEALLIGRAVQGLGGGGLISLSFALVRQSVDGSDHVRYQSRLTAAGVFASAMGPVIGGFITEHAGWRWIFFLNLPVALLALALILLLPPRRRPADIVRFDWSGLLLLSVSIAAMMFAINQLRGARDADLAVSAAMLAFSFLGFSLLFWIEKKARNPVIPIELLRNISIRRAESLAILHGALLASLMTFSPIYFGIVRSVPPDIIGVLMLPLATGIGIGSIFTGSLIARTGRSVMYPVAGMALSAAVLVLLMLEARTLSLLSISIALGVISFLLGTVMVVVHTRVLAEAGPHSLGAASGSVALARGMGASIGTALVSAVMFAFSTGDTKGGSTIDEESFTMVFLALAVIALSASVVAYRIPERS